LFGSSSWHGTADAFGPAVVGLQLDEQRVAVDLAAKPLDQRGCWQLILASATRTRAQDMAEDLMQEIDILPILQPLIGLL